MIRLSTITAPTIIATSTAPLQTVSVVMPKATTPISVTQPPTTAPVAPTISKLTEPVVFTPISIISPDVLAGLTASPPLKAIPSATSGAKPIPVMIPPKIIPEILETTFDPNDIIIQPVHREHATFDPYGEVTGVSNQRPMIAAATTFEPVFVPGAGKNVSGNPFTFTGRYVTEQFFVRRCIEENITNLLKELGSNNLTAPSLHLLMARVLRDFQTAFHPVVELMGALDSLEQLKKSFEIRRYVTYSSQAHRTGATGSGGVKFVWNVPTSLNRVALNELFTSDLRFRESAYREFSNTKVMYQLIYELQHFVKNHSYDLVRFDTSAHTRDDTTTQIVKNVGSSPKYSIAFLERFKGIRTTIDDLEKSYNANDTDTLLRKIKASIRLINRELPTNVPDRLALTFNLLSKEYRTSTALGSEKQRANLTSLGLDLNSDTHLFDQLTGDIPDKITDIIRPGSRASLANVMQIIDGNVAVLPFEQHHLDTENGVYTPGSEYLVDSIINDPSLKFDAERLNKYDSIARSASSALDEVMTGLNLIDPALKYSKNAAARSDLFFARMLAEFTRATYTNGDLSKGMLSGQNDVLVAVIALCQQDETLKALLMSLLLIDDFVNPPEKVETTAGGLVLPGYVVKMLAFQTEIINRIAARTRYVLAANKGFTLTSGVTLSGVTKTTAASSDVIADKLSAALGSTSTTASDASYLTKIIAPLTTSPEVKAPAASEEFREALMSAQMGKLRALFKETVADFTDQKCFDSVGRTHFNKVPELVIRELVMEAIIGIASRFGFSNLKLTSTGDMQVVSDTTKTTLFKMFAEKLVVVPDLHKALESDIAAEADSFDPQVRILIRKLLDEENAIKKIYLALHGILTGVTGRTNTVLTNFAPGTGKHTKLFNEISTIVNSSLISLIDAAQVRLAIAQSLDINFAFILAEKKNAQFSFIDGAVPTIDSMFALWSLLSEPRFQSDKAENLRILTIGIPAGFSRKLQERVRIANVKDNVNVTSKQKDVIRIKVYKRSLEFPDLVFEPKEFLFELSRFVAPTITFDQLASKDAPQIPDFGTVLNKARTVNIEGNVNVLGILGTTANADLKQEEYDFLSQAQKDEIVQNHVTSALLELYGRLMTGVNLNEQAFLLDPTTQLTTKSLIDPATLKTLIDNHVRIVAKVPDFDSSVTNIDTLNLSSKVTDKLGHDMRHLSALAFSRTTLTDPMAEVRRALTPKVFERTFQVPVDPDDFNVDYTKSTATEHGRESMKRLITTGKVVQKTNSAKSGYSAVDTYYRLNDENNRRGTVTLEQYFVTVETILGTLI